MGETVRLKYVGSTPGTDSNTYTVFDTTTAANGIPRDFIPSVGFKRFLLNLEHSHACTLNWYWSLDRGTTWIQDGTETLAAPAAAETSIRDFLVEGHADWKLELVNGGTAQSPFVVNMSLTDERSVAD
jgi:hypothetical protein